MNKMSAIYLIIYANTIFVNYEVSELKVTYDVHRYIWNVFLKQNVILLFLNNRPDKKNQIDGSDEN